MDRISPLFSAIRMNLSGGTSPNSGCCQRRSASNPVIFPVAISICGWYTRNSSFLSSASRKAFSKVNRSIAEAFISSVKNRKPLCPLPLALYIAASAFLIRVSPSAPCSGNMLTPMLQLTLRECPWTKNPAVITAMSRSAATAAPATSFKPVNTTRNSSPPDPSHGVLFPYPLLKALCNFLQEKVADRVPERVVNDFEAVEVEEQERDSALLPTSTCECLSQSILKKPAIR